MHVAVNAAWIAAMFDSPVEVVVTDEFGVVAWGAVVLTAETATAAITPSTISTIKSPRSDAPRSAWNRRLVLMDE